MGKFTNSKTFKHQIVQSKTFVLFNKIKIYFLFKNMYSNGNIKDVLNIANIF